MQKAALKVTSQAVGTIRSQIFGSFVEHMGRCVYGGIFDPGSPFADAKGFRTDVVELTREMGVSVVRYPGGNFVSGYRWEDGVGPVESRPTRLDLAWRSIEPNSFGLNEFMNWARLAEVEPMMAVNLGTRGVQEAADLIEYCNSDCDTQLSQLRQSHGIDTPHNIRAWCLGNEMDGPWQIGHKNAEDYAKLAAETAKAMRLVDPDITLIVCGSSHEEMPTFGDWETTVLEHSIEHVDLISLHAYYEKYGDDRLSFLASSARMDRFIQRVIERADEVSRRKGLDKRVNLSFDEWNVWYQKRFEGVDQLEFRHAPRLIEDEYTVEDAVVVGSLLMTLMAHADRVDFACQAQLANVIGPIRVEKDCPAWRQTTFFPFALSARAAGHTVLSGSLETRSMDAELFEGLPMTQTVVTQSDDSSSLMIFALNRELEDETQLTIDLTEIGSALEYTESHCLGGGNLELTNNLEHPEQVVPGALREVVVDGSTLTVVLPPTSWSAISLRLVSPS